MNKRLIKSNDEGGSPSFNTVLYTGTGSGSKSVTGVGFQPDLVWGKARSAVHPHILFDSVRGENKQLSSNDTTAEVTRASDAYLFDPDGFTVTTVGNLNNAFSYVAWCWKAGGAAVSNTDGTITSQVSANVEAGFSIVSFTSGSFGSTYGHGLGSAPKMYFLKRRDDTSDWVFYTTVIDGSLDFLFLNKTDAKGDTSPAPTDSVFTFNVPAGLSYIAYCFADVAGFSKFGSYTGGGATDVTVTTGFQPAFLMFKRTDSTGNWIMFDNKRSTSATDFDNFLYPNLSDSEVPNIDAVTTTATGFIVTRNNAAPNFSGGTYIYMAFANQF